MADLIFRDNSVYLNFYTTGGGIYQVAISEGMKLSEVLTEIAKFPKVFAEGIKISDDPAEIAKFIKSSTEGFKCSDATVEVVKFIESITEGFKLSEVATALSIILRLVSASDGFKFSDSNLEVAKFLKLMEESFKFSENRSMQGTFYRNLIEGIKLSEIITKLVFLRKSTSDGIKFSDTSQEIAKFNELLEDNISLEELVRITIGFIYAICSDGISLRDFILRAKKAGITDIRTLLSAGVLNMLSMLGETVDIFPDGVDADPIVSGINALPRSPKKDEIKLFSAAYDTKETIIFEVPRVGGGVDLSVMRPHKYKVKYGTSFYEIDEIIHDDAETSTNGEIDSAVLVLLCKRLSGRIGEIS